MYTESQEEMELTTSYIFIFICFTFYLISTFRDFIENKYFWQLQMLMSISFSVFEAQKLILWFYLLTQFFMLFIKCENNFSLTIIFDLQSWKMEKLKQILKALCIRFVILK